MTIDLHSKFLGTMIGGAVGDAIGELAFGHPARDELLACVEQAEQLRYTDDTVMTLAVAQTLIDHGDIDPQILGNLFRELYHREPWRGYGESSRLIFSLVENEGIGYLDAARRLQGGAGSYGNGAAMRIAPVGLYCHNAADFYEKVAAAARITHAHAIAVDGAAVLARAQSRLLMLNSQRPFSPQAIVDDLIEFAQTTDIKDKLHQVAELIERENAPEEAAARLGLSTAAHESVPFALFCFLSHPHELMECVLAAVLTGGDRDTMGAMAGSLAGAFLGIDAVPAAWRQKLENSQHIETLARELAVRTQS